MESPETRSFSLGNFFDIWGQPLSADRVGEFTNDAPLRIIVDGKPFTGDPRTIELKRHTQIALEVGPTFVDPTNFTFPTGD